MMFNKPVPKHALGVAIRSAFGWRFDNDAFKTSLKAKLASEGVRFATVHSIAMVPKTQQFQRHISIRAEIKETKTSFIDCVLKIDSSLNILIRKEEEKIIEATPWKSSTTDPRHSMGDYRDDRR